MSDVIAQRIGGNFLYIDKNKHLKRVVDAIGPDVIAFKERFLNSLLAAADAPAGWTVTLVEGGAGESTITKPDGVDAGILLTTDAAENDGINLQLDGESFKLNSSCRALSFYAKLRVSEATQLDFLVGLCITNTALLGGMTDGIYFEKLDGGTGISAVTEKDSTETQSDSLGTCAADTDVELEFFYDKDDASVEFFIDGVSVAKHTANICDDEDLTPSVQVLTGAAAAETLQLRELRVIQIGY